MIKNVFLTSLVHSTSHTKCVSLSNQKCEIQPNLINLHPNEYSQDLHYCPFAVKLNKCVGSCNTLNDLSIKVCVSKKTEDLNIHVFNMITEKNESKILTKDISFKRKCRGDGKIVTQINGGITIINVDVSVKNVIYVKNIIFGILLHVVVKMKSI